MFEFLFSPFSTIYSAFSTGTMILVNPLNITIAGHFLPLNECNCLPNEVVCTAIYSFTTVCGKEEGEEKKTVFFLQAF